MLILCSALSKCFDGLTNKLIASKDTEAKARSILALSLKNQELTPEVIDHATSQLRTFLFAGYDTTASSMAWTLYFLGKKENKAALEAILEELDTVLGTDDAEVARKLGNKVGDVDLPLMINALKESMRVMPPASATRGVTKKQKDFFITFRDGSRHKVNGSMLMTANRLVMTNPNVWGEDAAIWRPSRWEDKEYIAALPPGAYRPFEHGPRDCIGRTVAMEEMKVLLAMVLRKWRFEKVTKEENISVLGEVWGEYSILTVPHDRMNGVLRRRGEEYINGAPAVYAKH